jgi:ABC-type polysaccharide/polyol phosphate transport system ATPase subunit
MKELISDEDRTVVIVSHSLDTIKNLCDEVLWLHEGKIVEMGKPEKVIEKYSDFMAQQNS